MAVKKGKIIIIVAPSGTGKSTLIKRLKSEFTQFVESVSFTTRLKRQGETNGEHYLFINEENFLKRRDNNEFLEWAVVHGDYKATSRELVESEMVKGNDLLFDLDVQGADAFKQHFGNLANVIFVKPPTVEELENRLRSRGTEPEENINLRLDNSKKELKRQNDFDYLIVNDDFDRAYGELRNIVTTILKGSPCFND